MTRALAAVSLGAALATGAVLFGLQSLYVPAIGLVFLGAACSAWTKLGALSAGLELWTPRTAVEEGEPLELTVATRLARWSPPARLVLRPLTPGSLRMRRGRTELRVPARLDRRGWRRLGPARLETADPLGLCEQGVEASAVELLVLPRVEPVLVASRSGREGGPGAPGGRRAGPELELDSLRAHRPGTPASRIHWPTVARIDQLFERRLVADADTDPLVVLDAAAPVSEEALDRAVRAAASLCVALGRAGGCRLLLPGERRPMTVRRDLRGWPAAHSRLATVESLEGPPRPPVGGGATAVFFVTAGRREPTRALRRPQATYLVAPLEVLQGSATFTVAGCGGRPLARARSRAA